MEIHALDAGGGVLAISPLPGLGGNVEGDVAAIAGWGAGLVLTMTTARELDWAGAADLGARLAMHGIGWHHLPIRDFGAPPPEVAARWPAISSEARGILAAGGRVLAHCRGGCGRSGMAALRLMVELGEPPDAALARLRAVRPCAVETAAQMAWASG